MAYISSEQVKEIRNEIKKVLTAKDGFKLSITKRHSSTICVQLLQSPIAIDKAITDVNDHYLYKIECKNTKTIFELIDKAVERVMGVCYDRNSNDPGADYSNFNFFKRYSIGDYGKPCIITSK